MDVEIAYEDTCDQYYENVLDEVAKMKEELNGKG